MTENSHSLQGRDRYFSQQYRISNWVVETEEHRAQFGNALTVPPSIASSARVSNCSSHQRSRTAPSSPCSSISSTTILDNESLKVATEPVNQHGPAVPAPSHLSHHRDDRSNKPRSHSSSHRRSSSQPQAPHSRKSKTPPTYIVTIPPTTSPTYTYGPSGWVPSAGLVIISSKRKKVSTLYPQPEQPKPPVTPSPPQLYKHCPACPPLLYAPLVYPQAQKRHGTTYYPPPQVSNSYNSVAPATYVYPQAAYPSSVTVPGQPPNAPVQVQGSYIYSQPLTRIVYPPFAEPEKAKHSKEDRVRRSARTDKAEHDSKKSRRSERKSRSEVRA